VSTVAFHIMKRYLLIVLILFSLVHAFQINVPKRHGDLLCRVALDPDSASPTTPVLATEENKKVDVVNTKTSNSPNIQAKKVMAKTVEWLIKNFIQKSSQFVAGLDVHVSSKTNRNIILGQVDSLEIKFDKIAYGQIWCTAGGSLIFKGVNLRMRRFLFQNKDSLRQPYELIGDFNLTQSDIINSKFIRNIFQFLVTTVIKRALKLPTDILDLEIKRVMIRKQRIFIYGEADLVEGGAIVPFEISTSMGTRAQGQVIFLRDSELVLNPESVLRTAVPVITTSAIDVDIGEDCTLERLEFTERQVRIRARTKVLPTTLMVENKDSSISRGRFHYDLGAVISNIFRFNKRIVG